MIHLRRELIKVLMLIRRRKVGPVKVAPKLTTVWVETLNRLLDTPSHFLCIVWHRLAYLLLVNQAPCAHHRGALGLLETKESFNSLCTVFLCNQICTRVLDTVHHSCSGSRRHAAPKRIKQRALEMGPAETTLRPFCRRCLYPQ